MTFRPTRTIAALLAFLAGCGATPAPVTAPSQPPAAPCDRIVSMAPSLTEMAYALDLQDRLVGVTRYCVYPPEAHAKPSVGGFLDPNYEAILVLQPTIVLTLPAHEEIRQKLAALGIRYETMGEDTLDGIFSGIEQMGALCGARDKADALLGTLRGRVAAIRAKVAALPHPRTLIVIGRDYASPALEQVFIAGPGRFQSQLVEAAGGVNVYDGPPMDYPAIGPEGLMRLNPDVILEMAPDVDLPDETLRAAWETLPNIAAVRDKRIYILRGDYISIPGPRVVNTLEDIARALHPDAEFGA